VDSLADDFGIFTLLYGGDEDNKINAVVEKLTTPTLSGGTTKRSRLRAVRVPKGLRKVGPSRYGEGGVDEDVDVGTVFEDDEVSREASPEMTSLAGLDWRSLQALSREQGLPLREGAKWLKPPALIARLAKRKSPIGETSSSKRPKLDERKDQRSAEEKEE